MYNTMRETVERTGSMGRSYVRLLAVAILVLGSLLFLCGHTFQMIVSSSDSNFANEHLGHHSLSYLKNNKSSDTKKSMLKVCQKYKIRTFFSEVKSRFSEVALSGNDSLSTTKFLECSKEYAQIFDVLGKIAFKPIKIDYLNNVEIINNKLKEDPVKYSTFEGIVSEDMARGTQETPSSVTLSLIWLTRSLMFLSSLMDSIADAETFRVAVESAYYSTIRQYHGFSIKFAFKMAMPLLPSKDDVIKLMAVAGQDPNSKHYANCMFQSMNDYNSELKDMFKASEEYFKKKNLVLLHKQT